MKQAFTAMIKGGQRTGRISATYCGSKHGHLIFREGSCQGGQIDHFWINRRAIGQLPDLQNGQRISFFANLQGYRKTTGEFAYRIEDVREVKLE